MLTTGVFPDDFKLLKVIPEMEAGKIPANVYIDLSKAYLTLYYINLYIMASRTLL